MNELAGEVVDRLRSARSLSWLRAIDAAELDSLAHVPDERGRPKGTNAIATNIDQHAHRLALGARDELQQRDGFMIAPQGGDWRWR